MMKNYLEMVQSVERDREALIFSDHVYSLCYDSRNHFTECNWIICLRKQ